MSATTIKRALVNKIIVNLPAGDSVTLDSENVWGHCVIINTINQNVLLPLAVVGMSVTFYSNFDYGTDFTGLIIGGGLISDFANTNSAKVTAQDGDTIRGGFGTTDYSFQYLPINRSPNSVCDTKCHQFICFQNGVWTPIQRTTTAIYQPPSPPP